MSKANAERLPDIEFEGEARPYGWSVCTHGNADSWEVSVCHSTFTHGFRSWGWFGPTKMQVRGSSLDECQKRALLIAMMFNQNKVSP